MKYNVGDRVRIKSIDWYNENKDEIRDVDAGLIFDEDMSMWCGKTMTILEVHQTYYTMEEECPSHYWTDEMIEGLVEEESEKKLSDESWRYKNIFDYSQYPQSFECPEGYIFKDENGNIINATKIVLEKKKKEYPKTYEECCKVLNVAVRDFDILYNMLDTTETIYTNNLDRLLNSFRKLLICRDAYWKIAGEEMGLGKPWKPDWKNDEQFKYIIICRRGCIIKDTYTAKDVILAFPTEEIRDAFKENFDPDIEKCKEFL